MVHFYMYRDVPSYSTENRALRIIPTTLPGPWDFVRWFLILRPIEERKKDIPPGQPASDPGSDHTFVLRVKNVDVQPAVSFTNVNKSYY